MNGHSKRRPHAAQIFRATRIYGEDPFVSKRFGRSGTAATPNALLNEFRRWCDQRRMRTLLALATTVAANAQSNMVGAAILLGRSFDAGLVPMVPFRRSANLGPMTASQAITKAERVPSVKAPSDQHCGRSHGLRPMSESTFPRGRGSSRSSRALSSTR